MSGLQKIIDKISADSAAECDKLLADARRQAASITSAAEEQAQQLLQKADEEAQRAAAEIAERSVSACEQRSKQVILAAKIQAIDDTLDAALEALRSLDDAEYFDALMKLLVKNAVPGKGVLRFSERDLKRLPADFEKRANALLNDRGASVMVGRESADIADGFILVCGDIEYNCTFRALFDESRDELRELVCSIIF